MITAWLLRNTVAHKPPTRFHRVVLEMDIHGRRSELPADSKASFEGSTGTNQRCCITHTLYHRTASCLWELLMDAERQVFSRLRADWYTPQIYHHRSATAVGHHGTCPSESHSNNVSLDLPLLTSAPSKKLITGIDFWHLMVRGILTIRLNRQVIPRKLRTVLERASLNLLASEVADEASPKVPLKESRSPILELFISLQAIQHGRE